GKPALRSFEFERWRLPRLLHIAMKKKHRPARHRKVENASNVARRLYPQIPEAIPDDWCCQWHTQRGPTISQPVDRPSNLLLELDVLSIDEFSYGKPSTFILIKLNRPWFVHVGFTGAD